MTSRNSRSARVTKSSRAFESNKSTYSSESKRSKLFGALAPHRVTLLKFTMASSGSKLLVGPALRAAVNLNSSKIPTELSKSSAAFLSSAPSGGLVSLPDLPYDYAALERTSLEPAMAFVLITFAFRIPKA